jgi:formylglycine-generating enzyme required for sulfatase activity
MHGNVRQWCEDRWDDAGPDRVLCGGCWQSIGLGCQAAFRYRFAPSMRRDDAGFRLARVPSGSK